MKQYNRSLDGVRALASFGIMATHVAFQTGVDPATNIGAILARFDFFVAVFFALSGFVLWRGIDKYQGRWGAYYRNRFARIAPAYLVCVVAVILLLPDTATMTGVQIFANLTLTQIYFPDALAPGLTHLWSLCVEVAFYAVLPLLALVPRRLRVPVIAGLAVLSLGWAWLPFVENAEVNRQIWPPAYMSWFAVGLLGAEAEGRVRFPLFQVRWVWWLLALAIAWLAGQEFFGPLGLTHPNPSEFTRRVIAGACFAACIVLPYALAPREGLMTKGFVQRAGQISYSVFLWHVPILALVFPILGLNYFSGSFLLVYTATAALTYVAAVASYEWVEAPVGRWLRGKT